MNYQDFCVKQVKSALEIIGSDKEQFNNVSQKYALKNGLIGLYAETYTFNGKQMKFFDVNFHGKGNRGKEKWKVLLGSEKAYELCQQIESGEIVKPKKSSRNVPFYEHIEPKSVTYRNLCELRDKIEEERIKSILDKSKLVILTYDEKECLDRRGEVFTDGDISTIEDWVRNNEISEGDGSIAIQSMKNGNEYLKCDDNGSAYARIAHLWNKGIRFKWGSKEGLEAITGYLNCEKHDY